MTEKKKNIGPILVHSFELFLVHEYYIVYKSVDTMVHIWRWGREKKNSGFWQTGRPGEDLTVAWHVQYKDRIEVLQERQTLGER